MGIIKESVENFKKELGALSSHLIEVDEEYRQRIIRDAKIEMIEKLVDEMDLEAVFSEHDTGPRPRNDMPAFQPTNKTKILQFRVISSSSR